MDCTGFNPGFSTCLLISRIGFEDKKKRIFLSSILYVDANEREKQRERGKREIEGGSSEREREKREREIRWVMTRGMNTVGNTEGEQERKEWGPSVVWRG